MNLAGMIQRWRRFKLARRGLRLDRSCYVGPAVSLGVDTARKIPGVIEVGLECEINRGVELNPWGGAIRLGRRVWLGPYAVIYGHGGVEIGDQTLVSMHVSILSSDHSVPERAKMIRNCEDVLKPTKIGKDVWVGANAVILGGVIIGDGCVIGAGSVVTKDLPPYSVAMGVPARVVRTRT